MLKKAVLVLISVMLVFYLMRQIDVRQVFFAILRVPPLYLLGSFTLFIMGHFSRALRFQVLPGIKRLLAAFSPSSPCRRPQSVSCRFAPANFRSCSS